MSANAELIGRFYAAFQARDAEGMVACYAADVRFSDPVFPALVGERAKAMWRMLVGRGKDLVITGGYNVYPIEVEAEIDALPGVIESAVIGVAHPDFGEGVTAVVVKRRDAAIDEAAVRQALAQRLAGFKLPKRVVFVEELPRNTMGKVQKSVLRETYRALYIQG